MISEAHSQQLQLKYVLPEALVRVLEKRREALPEGQIGLGKLLEILEAQAQKIRALESILQAQAGVYKKLTHLSLCILLFCRV